MTLRSARLRRKTSRLATSAHMSVATIVWIIRRPPGRPIRRTPIRGCRQRAGRRATWRRSRSRSRSSSGCPPLSVMLTHAQQRRATLGYRHWELPRSRLPVRHLDSRPAEGTRRIALVSPPSRPLRAGRPTKENEGQARTPESPNLTRLGSLRSTFANLAPCLKPLVTRWKWGVYRCLSARKPPRWRILGAPRFGGLNAFNLSHRRRSGPAC